MHGFDQLGLGHNKKCNPIKNVTLITTKHINNCEKCSNLH